MGPPLPLIDRAADARMFQRLGGAVSAATFLADVQACAATLPGAGPVVNLCRDRYAFAVAFAATVVAGRTALLNVEPGALAGVAAAHPGAIAAADWDAPASALPCVMIAPAARAGVQAPPVPAIPANHLAAIVFTSGSTGAPAAHRKSWGELAHRSRSAAAQFGLGGGTVIGMVPPQHMYGFETTVLLPLHAPVASWCGPAFFPADVAAALLACPGPRTLVTTPLQLRNLLHAGLQLPPLDSVISATAPLDPAIAQAAENAFATRVLEIFGATEVGSIASRRTTAGPGWTPYPGIRIDFAEAGAIIHADHAAPTPLADVLEPSAEGFRLLGRRTDLVKLGGRRASLVGLNQLLTALPGIDDGAFVLPDEAQGATPRLVAVVVAPARTGPSILADLRRVIEPIFMPRRVIRVERMPRNALGKLPRQALLQLVAQAG